MARYYFDLSDGEHGAQDQRGTELPDNGTAIAYGKEIAHDLMRNNERKNRHFSIAVCDEAHELLFTLPFVFVDETIRHLHPDLRTQLEVCYARRRGLAEAIDGARQTIRQSRALVARSRRRPYLAAVNGAAVV
jgi:hypothetical protein